MIRLGRREPPLARPSSRQRDISARILETVPPATMFHRFHASNEFVLQRGVHWRYFEGAQVVSILRARLPLVPKFACCCSCRVWSTGNSAVSSRRPTPAAPTYVHSVHIAVILITLSTNFHQQYRLHSLRGLASIGYLKILSWRDLHCALCLTKWLSLVIH